MRKLLTEKKVENLLGGTLEEALRGGNGIALICVLIECPICNDDIWVVSGAHSGDGGNENYAIIDTCYECNQEFRLHIQNIIKDMTFATISEHTTFVYTKNKL